MGYASVLTTFKIEYEACVSVKDNDDSKVLNVNDRGNEQKIVRRSPMFKEGL